MNASFDNPNAQRQTGEGWPTTPLSADIPICILAGGLSTRLRPLTETMPKPMVPVAGKPFVQHVLEHLGRLGFRRFILAVSYLWEQIYDYFGDGGQFGWELKYSVEPNALGTGGAVLGRRNSGHMRCSLPMATRIFPKIFDTCSLCTVRRVNRRRWR